MPAALPLDLDDAAIAGLTRPPLPGTPAALVEAAAGIGRDLAVGAAERDLGRGLAQPEFDAIVRAGILAARVPAQHGGPEVDFVSLARIFVHLGAGDPNLAQSLQPHTCLMEKLRIYASPAQQRRYFGQVLGGSLITNAGAERGGKVVGEIRTVLSSANASHRLHGAKHYCTGSAYAASYFVLAATPEGKALAMVPGDRAGVTVLDDWDGMGQRTTSSGTVQFDDVVLDEDEIIILKGFGVRSTHEGATAQLLHAAIDAGIAQAAFDDALLLAQEGVRAVPESGVATTAEDPYVQHAVGDMAMTVHGAVALVERGAALVDRAAAAFLRGAGAERLLGEASVAVAEAKMAAELASLKVGEMLYRVAGASATRRNRNLDRHWRNARTHTTHDPVSYKAKAVGDFYLNGRLPPISTKY